MHELTHQALPERHYLELLGAALCVFNSNNAFIIKTILRMDMLDEYDWWKLTDLEAGKLKQPIHNVISTKCGDEIETLFVDLIQRRNRIIHSYRITNSSKEQVLATKVKGTGIQFEITEKYLLEFIKQNDILSNMLNNLRNVNH